jgi:hypothetical protein
VRCANSALAVLPFLCCGDSPPAPFAAPCMAGQRWLHSGTTACSLAVFLYRLGDTTNKFKAKFPTELLRGTIFSRCNAMRGNFCGTESLTSMPVSGRHLLEQLACQNCRAVSTTAHHAIQACQDIHHSCNTSLFRLHGVDSWLHGFLDELLACRDTQGVGGFWRLSSVCGDAGCKALCGLLGSEILRKKQFSQGLEALAGNIVRGQA